MLEALGEKRGVSGREIEQTMTIAQIRLCWHWHMRADTRRARVDEMIIKKAIAEVLGGSNG